MNVKNRKCIWRLSFKSMKSARLRNFVAVMAISLTTVLFTSLFTIIMSIADGTQQSNFRQIGTYSHGEFKYLTKEQFEEFKTDSMIKEYGIRRIVATPQGDAFDKQAVEISYMDKNTAKWSYLEPVKGTFPREGTNEAATDKKVLSLLGIEPEIGAEFTLTLDVDGVETKETFTLCGWWETDNASPSSNILVSESAAEKIFLRLGTQGKDGITGFYNLSVMLESSKNIEENLYKIIENHGYQCQSEYEENYIYIGVNWGYIDTRISENMDISTVVGFIAMLLLIIFTGYLIIYNIFRISVSNDIRYYGMLKTIGTTGKQIKRIVLIQALTLSAVGIPLGIIVGYIIGYKLTPFVLSQVSGAGGDVSGNVLIFGVAVVFSLITVMVSCHKPTKLAAKVSPIEALRYTESSGGKSLRKGKKGASIAKMAWANLLRSKGKTAVTVISMSLAVVLLNMTFMFANGFDMDKYLAGNSSADFLTADSRYFQSRRGGFEETMSLSDEFISEIKSLEAFEKGGKTYGLTGLAEQFVSEEYARDKMKKDNIQEAVNYYIENSDKLGDLIAYDVQLYGMEDYCLEKLKVIEGDISKIRQENCIIAVYLEDENGNVDYGSNYAKVGDKVTVRFYNSSDSNSETQHSEKYTDCKYEVVALASIPDSMGYRYYGSDEFILYADEFISKTGTSAVMYYAFDVAESEESKVENFMADYTQNINTDYNYESKAMLQKEFESFKNMFMILGGTLSIIVGLVGVLNFLNAVLTGIITRKREFAVLQSVGMTGRQLKGMLICEGLSYSLGSLAVTGSFIVVTSPICAKAFEMFWFFTYKFTIIPMLVTIPIFVLLGIAIPVIAYKFVSKKSVVERLRETE